MSLSRFYSVGSRLGLHRHSSKQLNLLTFQHCYSSAGSFETSSSIVCFSNRPFVDRCHTLAKNEHLLYRCSTSLPLTQMIYNNRQYSNASSTGNIGSLVYEGRVKKMFKRLKILSLSTSAFGLLLQPYLWYSLQDVSLIATVPLFAAVNAFVFTNPFLIHFLSKRYVNELYYNPKSKEFTAKTLSFFARAQSFTYTAKDVVVPDLPGMFSMFTAKGRPLFVDERDFTSIEVYKHMMGFDQPLDLRYMSNTSRQVEKNDTS